MRSLITILALTATGALAECPTADDMAAGVKVWEEDGTVHLFRQTAPGKVTLKTDFADGYGALMTLDQGAYVLEIVDMDEGLPLADTLIAYDLYGAQAGPPPGPGAGVTWESPVAILDGGQSDFETHQVIWAKQDSLQLGDCTLSVVEGRFTYFSVDGEYYEDVIYLSDLGFALQTSWYDPEYGLDSYTPVWIEAVK